MTAQRERDTEPERALRKELHACGLRFRLHRHEVPGTRRTVDIVFGPARVAVDVRGCFWHGCEAHGTWPKTNADWWKAKITQNRDRDADTVQRLQSAGWLVVVVWEHEDPAVAAEYICNIVRSRRDELAQSSRNR